MISMLACLRHAAPWKGLAVRPRFFIPGVELLETRVLLHAPAGIGVLGEPLQISRLQKIGPLVQVSSSSPFAGSTADNLPGQSGTNYLNTEVEPSLTVDPLNPRHLVGAWQQDRWSNGGARDLVTGVTYDGGETWTLTPAPDAALVADGIYQRATDAWVSFAPDGTVYLALYAFNDRNAREAMLVYKSLDGGSTWGPPLPVLTDTAGNVADDKESVTADPYNPQFAYYTWDRLFFDPATSRFINGPAYFSRTTDGGQSWESARPIYGNAANTQTIGNEIVVTPDGTLLDVFTFFDAVGGTNIEAIRSTDHGATWSDPILIALEEPSGVTDPNNRVGLRTGADLPAVAVDPHSGVLYTVWEDGRFSRFAHDSIAMSLSKDGGLTWSAPIQVNKTPTSIPGSRQQAFTPSVAVAANGTVAVTYYDLRNPDNISGGLPTDYWMVFGSGSQDLTNPANWEGEQRLTNASFNMELAPVARGYFLGDYMGLTAGGQNTNAFSALFGQTVSASDRASIFFRDPPPASSQSSLADLWPALRTATDVGRIDVWFASRSDAAGANPAWQWDPTRPTIESPRDARPQQPDGKHKEQERRSNLTSHSEKERELCGGAIQHQPTLQQDIETNQDIGILQDRG